MQKKLDTGHILAYICGMKQINLSSRISSYPEVARFYLEEIENSGRYFWQCMAPKRMAEIFRQLREKPRIDEELKMKILEVEMILLQKISGNS